MTFAASAHFLAMSFMSAKYFLDTNIFVYCFDARDSGKRERAREIVSEAIGSGRGVISAQVVQEFFNVALRKFSRPWSLEESNEYAVSAFRPLLRRSIDLELSMRALRIVHSNKLSFYDASLIAAALDLECEEFFSEDLNPGQIIETVRILNPFHS